jgi:hypothetical protein
MKCARMPKDLAGFVSWLCCLCGSVIFGSIVLTTTGILSASSWIKDECTVVNKTDACLLAQPIQDGCSVNVSMRVNPVSMRDPRT